MENKKDYSLNSLVRRIKEIILGIQISVAMMLIPISIGLLLWILDYPHTDNPLLLMGLIILLVICWGGGIILWGKAINTAKKEDNENNNSRKELSDAIKELKETMKQIANSKKDKSE